MPDRNDERALESRRASLAPIVDSADEVGWALAVMSGAVRKGAWEPPESLRVIALMGGVELDYTEADVLEGESEIWVFALMGGAKIVVPSDVDVEVSGVGFMGGFSHVSHRSGVPDAPLLRIKGLAIMGGVEVKVR